MFQPKQSTFTGNNKIHDRSKAPTHAMVVSGTYKATNNGFINFSTLRLKETIQEHCLVTDIEKRKILVLICYNDTDAFGEVIDNWLNNSARFSRMLSDPIFTVYRHNITSEVDRMSFMESLTDIVRDHHDILYSVEAGQSMIYLLVPYCDIVVSQSYIDNSMNEDEAISMLSYMRNLFSEIKKQRMEQQKESDTVVTCESFQQLMMSRLRDRGYDIFLADEHQYLKDKIGFAYFGAPENTDGTYLARQNLTIERAYKVIISQSDMHAMDDGVVVISFIYICRLDFKKQRFAQTKQSVNSVNKEQFTPLPCFVLRKCYDGDKPSKSFCRTVIDSSLRVYRSWTNFLDENTYPKCVLCVPEDGRYDWDYNGNVRLEYFYSPSCGISRTAIRAIDKTVTVAGLGSGSLLLLAAIPVVTFIAPVALIGAAAVGIGAGVYSIGRNIYQLVDRSKHDEDLSPTDAEARAAYIGIIAGSLGFAGAGANVIIANLAKNGVRIGQGAILTVNALSKANLAAGGLAFTNSVYDVAHSYLINKQTPSPLVFVQFGSSILFFTNSIYQYKNATKLLVDAQTNNAIQDYNNLSKTPKGPIKILSGLKKAPNVDETRTMLLQNEDQFNQLGIKYADENVLYNGQIMSISHFTRMINTVDFVESTPITSSITKYVKNLTISDLASLIKIIPVSFDAKDVEVSILNLLHLFTPLVQKKLVNLIDRIFMADAFLPVSSLCNIYGNELREYLKNNGIVMQFILQLIKYLASRVENTLNPRSELSMEVRYVRVLFVNYFVSGRPITEVLVQDCIKYLNQYFATIVASFFKNMKQEEKIQTIKQNKQLSCTKCHGFYPAKK